MSKTSCFDSLFVLDSLVVAADLKWGCWRWALPIGHLLGVQRSRQPPSPPLQVQPLLHWELSCSTAKGPHCLERCGWVRRESE